jgi:hypothetical protein
LLQANGAIELLRAIGGGSVDWQWLDRGSVQEFGGQAIEADGGVLAVGASKQNRGTLCRSLLRTVETMLENYPLKFDTPFLRCVFSFSICPNRSNYPMLLQFFLWTHAATS